MLSEIQLLAEKCFSLDKNKKQTADSSVDDKSTTRFRENKEKSFRSKCYAIVI